MSAIRDGINLTKLDDHTLQRIINTLTLYPGVADQYRHNLQLSQRIGTRTVVHRCMVAIDAWVQCHTVTTAIPPSPESLAWSDLEGGSLHHAEPSFSKWFESVFDTLKDRA
jgi:hypothetical protein